MILPIVWDEDAAGIRVVDQTLLPGETVMVVLTETAALVTAIRELAVRGAPTLGVAGAMAVQLALHEAARKGWSPDRLDEAIDAVREARPTAVNLAWGVDAVRPLVPGGVTAVAAAVERIVADNLAANRELSRQAADWLLERVDRPTVRALTHCNAGSLATAGWGTALGVLRELHERGRLELVYADETRPLLQGSRLTAYELAEAGIPHVVQADSAAASTILGGLVDFAVVGADRIAANGDTANKIGTLGVALACREAGIPFLVAAPWSTVDLATSSGEAIRIEERDGDEVVVVGGARTVPAGTRGFNPAFDVTPARLIDAIASERGIVEPDSATDLATLRP